MVVLMVEAVVIEETTSANEIIADRLTVGYFFSAAAFVFFKLNPLNDENPKRCEST